MPVGGRQQVCHCGCPPKLCGRSIGSSPGLPRGGGVAEECDGVRPRSLRATAPRNSHRPPTTDNKKGPVSRAHFVPPSRPRRALFLELHDDVHGAPMRTVILTVFVL